MWWEKGEEWVQEKMIRTQVDHVKSYFYVAYSHDTIAGTMAGIICT